MNVLIIGCGWVGTFVATNLINEGHQVWATTTTPEKYGRLMQLGAIPTTVDFDHPPVQLPVSAGLTDLVFDLCLISVPITYKDTIEQVKYRFTNLLEFLAPLKFGQLMFFGSVGIYPKVSATIKEDTFGDEQLDPKLLLGEIMLRTKYPQANLLRLGGLFGFERTIAKHFVGKVCEIGYQTANFVHVVDIYGAIKAMIARQVHGKTYSVVSPEHPLKKDVIAASAAKYGYGLPSAYLDADQTAKKVSPDRLINDLGYQFQYPSPLDF